MTSLQTKRLAHGTVLLASSFLADTAAANAQAVNYSVGAVVQSLKEDAGSALARHLRDLNTSPRNLTSLLGAGNAAIQVGDPQTALTFFARAEEVAPRDGRVKAGMGSAFVQTEQAQAALRFFAEALSLGAPMSLIARDRGLAYDMVGDPARAQADYAVALQRGGDAEVERRMALSKAISGDREAALVMLEPQIRRGDRAGFRARAFVLALTGDAAGAAQAVQAVMPAQANAMRPFLARLPLLGNADQAMAVHFGRFPRDGQTAAYANVQTAQAAPTAVPTAAPTSAGRPNPAQPALGSRSSNPAPVAQARQRSQRQAQVRQPAARTSRMTERASSLIRVPEPTATGRLSAADVAAMTTPRTQPVATQANRQAAVPRPVQAPPTIFSQVEQARSASIPGFAPAPAAAPPPVATADLTPSSFALDATTRPEQTAQVETSTAPAAAPPQSAPSPAAPLPTADAGNFDFGDVINTVQSLPAPLLDQRPIQLAEASPAPPRPAPSKPAAAKPAPEKKTSAKKPPEKKAEPAAPKEPSRIWVQLAAAQDKGAFPAEFRRLKGKTAKLLADKTAWTAPLGRTNRLLVGPFKTDKEARSFVNELSKMQVSSYSWTSDAGEKVEKLPAR